MIRMTCRTPTPMPKRVPHGKRNVEFQNAHVNRKRHVRGRSGAGAVQRRELRYVAVWKSYCYRNPLASNGEKLRNPWYDTDCCPPNIERLFESLPGYLYGMASDGVYVNLYHSSQLDWHLRDGNPLRISQATAYPWNGDVRLTVEPAKPAAFAMYLRWPSWASNADVTVNGQISPVSDFQPGSYISLNRMWKRGDTVSITFPMQPTEMAANPHVTSDYGRVAMQRGPLVYAMEQMDQGGPAMGDIFVRPNSPLSAEWRKDWLGGVTVIKVGGQIAEKSTMQEPLYQPLAVANGRAKRPASLVFIPYYAVNNREPTPMEVWVQLTRAENAAVASNGRPGGF